MYNRHQLHLERLYLQFQDQLTIGYGSICQPFGSLYVHTRNVESCLPSKIYRKGTVNGVSVSDTLLDTGASRTLVKRDLVSGKKTAGEMIPVKCAHGHAFTYPTAEVELPIEGG